MLDYTIWNIRNVKSNYFPIRRKLEMLDSTIFLVIEY